MRINHLIIGCEDIEKSKTFYIETLGLSYFDSFIDTGTKNQGHILLKPGPEEFELLLVPFNDERLPSPQHLAFEVDEATFGTILNNAESQKLNVRAMPPLDCKIKGVGTTEVRGKKYERFYILDPNRVNIEIMKLC